jgi:carbon monoxide dehydrogenase subunit G
MELTGGRLLPVPRQRVWDALMNTEILRAAIPGCEAIEDQGNGLFLVRVVAAIGPVKARFKGRLQQQDLQAPERYTLSFEGDGGVAGFARGSAQVQLTESGLDGVQTRLDYQAQAQIGGRLAQIGSRLVDATAAQLSAQFFDRLVKLVAAPEAPQAPATAASPAAPLSVATPADARTALPVQPPPEAPARGRGSVTLQMPAWTWAFTVAVLALLIAWLAVR